MALHTMGLDSLLKPINIVLDKPLSHNRSFGDAILLFRHSHLVHGNFSPENIEYLVQQTEMRNPKQQMRLSELIWELFNQLVLLDLQIMATLTALKVDIEVIVIKYMKKLK